MAESALQESTPEHRDDEPKEPIADFVGRMSDRAIQRVTGGNAFLRGRLYARRKAVDSLEAHGHEVSGQIVVRSATEPYKTQVALGDDQRFTSSCSCPGWRGPTGHCKHVAAILVALRDRERPPKPKGEEGKVAPPPAGASPSNGTAAAVKKKKAKEKSEPIHVPGTVSVGGKRRRSRRRRRGPESGAPLEVLKPVDLRDTLSSESRGVLDTWLPADALGRPQEFEYRVNVRSASITVTPVIAGTRHAVPIEAALAGFNVVPVDERPLFRALARHANRGQPATAELRAEDAADLIGLLRERRVLLEPASMELRITDEPLRPKIELDRANAGSMRVRVVFVLESNGRRFSLSNGAWFEGTPGYHIDTTEGVARPVLDSVTPAWLTRLYRSPALVLPDSELPVLLTDFIPKVANSLGADLPELESVADVVDAQPRFELRADGDIVTANVRLRARYHDESFDVPTVGIAPPLAFLPALTPGGRPRVVRRDVGGEMAAVQRLLNLGLQPGESREDVVGTGETAIEFWTNGIASLPADWAKFVPDDLAAVKIRGETVTPQMRVASGVDWLSLDMTFSAGGAVVAEDELRACLAHGRRIVKLSDGTFAPVDPDAVSDILSRMAEIYATGGDGKKLPLSQAGRINDLIQVIGNASVTTAAKSLFEKLDQVGEIPNVPKPRSLKATLRPYQKEGFNWLVFVHNLASGGILADDMGLGKTLQTIALLAWAKSKEDGKLSLVVAPTSVVPNWAREIEKFAPSLETVIWQGPDRMKLRDQLAKADVMITSYALLRRDEELLEGLDFKYVILDEAQHIKNPLSHTARAAKRIKSERRLALTGTPIENRLSEIWSIFDFVSPGLLGGLKAFEEKMARPIDRGDEETTARLRATIRPFVLRRLKSEVAQDLPEKIEQEIVVPLEDDQAVLYKQILAEVRKSVLSEIDKQGVAKAQIQILAALTRLRQVACDPRLMKLEGRAFTNDDSGKLGALREIVGEAVAGGHRVLIFSQFVEMLQIIKAALEEDQVRYEYLDGSTKDRMERVDRFNADESIPVFLVSLKAGGTGLNLTGADTVVHFDPWWNPAVEDQATDRAHRIGQSKVVNVYRLIARGTVEEKILQLSGKKRALVSSVLSADGGALKGLTKDDVDELFAD